MNTPYTIQKEEISTVLFGKQDVLISDEEKVTRRWELNRAVSLGNLYQDKVRIIFKDLGGNLQQVETTLWSVTEEYVMLKGGRYIPIRAIESIL